jgi:hypothetical protein
MDFKDPKNQILVLIVIVFLALIYVWYQKFYTPYAAELTSKKDKLEKILSNLHAVQQRAAGLQTLQQDYEAQAKRYEAVRLASGNKRRRKVFVASPYSRPSNRFSRHERNSATSGTERFLYVQYLSGRVKLHLSWIRGILCESREFPIHRYNIGCSDGGNRPKRRLANKKPEKEGPYVDGVV